MNFYSCVHSRVDIAEEEASELEGLALETKMKQEKRIRKGKAMGQLQGPRVWAAGVPSREAMRGQKSYLKK